MTQSTYEYVLEQLQLCKGNWSGVAEATGISKRTIEKIARREVKNPGVLTIEELAAHFRQSPAEPKLGGSAIHAFTQHE